MTWLQHNLHMFGSLVDRTYHGTMNAGCLHEAIATAGYDVTMELNTHAPDEDFYYAANAKNIMVSSGGYSRLMGNMVERNGGVIVGRNLDVEPLEG